MQQVLDALDRLGSSFYQSKCEYTRKGKKYPFFQELEFKPYVKYQRQLDELELIFCLEPSQLEVLLKIDRRANNLSGWVNEALDTDEFCDRLHVNSAYQNEPAHHLANKIEMLLQRHLR